MASREHATDVAPVPTPQGSGDPDPVLRRLFPLVPIWSQFETFVWSSSIIKVSCLCTDTFSSESNSDSGICFLPAALFEAALTGVGHTGVEDMFLLFFSLDVDQGKDQTDDNYERRGVAVWDNFGRHFSDMEGGPGKTNRRCKHANVVSFSFSRAILCAMRSDRPDPLPAEFRSGRG